MTSPKKKINFVTKGNDRIASYRMRAAIPAETINEHSTEFEATIADGCKADADVNVFSKHWNRDRDSTDIMITETKTIFDVCDDHFDRELGDYYKFMCEHASNVTCNTPRMQERIYDVTGRLALIIPDPITFPYHEFEYKEEPKFLWFGNAVNIFSIYAWMYDVPNLTIISNAKLPALPPHVRSIQWQPGLVENTIQEYDIILIPRNDGDWACTKSPNRAVDAIHSGRFVITDFAEVYDDLDPYLHIGDVQSGLAEYHNDPLVTQRMIEMGQGYVKTFNNHKSIYEGWAKAFNLPHEGDYGICCH